MKGAVQKYDTLDDRRGWRGDLICTALGIQHTACLPMLHWGIYVVGGPLVIQSRIDAMIIS